MKNFLLVTKPPEIFEENTELEPSKNNEKLSKATKERYFKKSFPFLEYVKSTNLYQKIKKFLIFPFGDKQFSFYIYAKNNIVYIHPRNFCQICSKTDLNLLYIDISLFDVIKLKNIKQINFCDRSGILSSYQLLGESLLKKYYNEKICENRVELWKLYSLSAKNLFVQVEKPEEIKETLNLEVQISEEFEPKDTFSLWVNPCIFSLPLEGNEVNNLRGFPVLNIDILFPTTETLRINFYKHVKSIIEECSSRPYSTVEALVWNDPGLLSTPSSFWKDLSWLPFAALDLLNGSFFISSKHNQSLSWLPPKNASQNTMFFASYWINQWRGELELEDKPIPKQADFPDPFPFRSHAPLTCTLKNEMEKKQIITNSSELAKKMGLNKNIYHFLDKIRQNLSPLENEELKSLIDKHLVFRQVKDNHYLHFDEINFLQTLAKKHINPNSSIYVSFPDGNFKNFVDEKVLQEIKGKYLEETEGLCINLISSVSLGDYRYFCLLFKSLFDKNNERGNKNLRYDNVWKYFWYESLFTKDFKKTTTYYIPTGCVLKHVVLASGRLGEVPFHMSK